MFFHSSHLLPFLFSIPRFLPSLTRSTSRSARLPLISSELALQQPRCAIRGICGQTSWTFWTIMILYLPTSVYMRRPIALSRWHIIFIDGYWHERNADSTRPDV